jgi:hypothetical protein
VLGGAWLVPTPVAGQTRRTERVILSLGNDQFIPKAAIEAVTDARFQPDLRGLRFLDEVSVIVLADIAFGNLPPALQANLAAWVQLGGSLLVTGGNNSFGLGGYAETPLAEILPLRPTQNDRTGHGFSPVYILNEGHPLFAGVTPAPMAFFNETTVAGDGRLLLEYRGVSKGGMAAAGLTGSGKAFRDPGIPGSSAGAGVPGGIGMPGIPNTQIVTIQTEGGIQGGGRAPMPLVAERRQGKGLVVAIALDMNATGEWRDRETFAVNLIRYGLDQAKLP